jgi:hypothetical protein
VSEYGHDQDHSAAIMRQYRCLRWPVVVLACALATVARAEVHVEGDSAAVRVTTSQETVSNVLSALAAALHFKYRTAVRLDASANAVYSGSLREVVAHLLAGYNYLIRGNRGTIEIVVISRRGDVAIPGARPPRTRRED